MSFYSSNSLERRHHPRRPLEGMVTFLPGIGPEVEGDPVFIQQDFEPARILNISLEGICLVFARNHWPHPIIRFRFDVTENTPIVVYAKMVWEKKNTCGFRFIVLSQANCLLIQKHLGL